MIQKTKTAFYNLISSLGYNVDDNGAYEETFPWLMLRTGGHQRDESLDIRIDIITLTLDIFSKYTGEKEILTIVDDISNHLWDLKENIPELIYCKQRSLHILDDNKKGPVRKHGVASYQFLLTTNKAKEETDDGSTGD